MHPFPFGRLKQLLAILGLFDIVALTATVAAAAAAEPTDVTRSFDESVSSMLSPFFNVITTAVRSISASLHQLYARIREGDLSIGTMAQCLALCGVLPGIWYLGSRGDAKKQEMDSSERSWSRGSRDGRSVHGSVAESTADNGTFSGPL